MKKYNLSLNNEINKLYNTLEEAKAVYDRYIRLARVYQSQFDGYQHFDHIAIDLVHVDENGGLAPIEYLEYFDGAKLANNRCDLTNILVA
ncbi:hypothetical protein HYO65_gp220 [Tenacibaculum phage PTm1]|uniref:Uncharacterized protein n=2 Tax=Shirahamavirus PTm1 TaxID=2846435 RepID=A0A5S9EQM4_9CAUD|nr:hypothetical protein HYO65_gp220 [Tenacibaculum phage PTm1]BBI90612.1 hypothetical protein [Tenacibaculum phage PTm1]BBI90918.1 hypothetical protein [Tenacibaculum phage PTm5]